MYKVGLGCYKDRKNGSKKLKIGVAFYLEMEYTIKHVRENKVFTLL